MLYLFGFRLHFGPLVSVPDNNIWSVNDYALRDLLVHLVQKYRIDEVYDSKVKAQNWEKLIQVTWLKSL